MTAEPIDEEAVYRKAVTEWRKTKAMVTREEHQRIEFAHGPVCIVFAADLHLGSAGVDYERIFAEAQTVVDTPGMYLMLSGDLLNNFIVPKLIAARHRDTVTIEEEWSLIRRYLRLVAGKLLVSVGGNHEKWTFVLAGIDYFAEVLRQISPKTIFNCDDVTVRLHVGKAQFPVRIRHKWRGSSIYNPTHGIERSFLFDKGFLCGVGAHTHACGVTRQFNAGGATGMAVLCGSYKIVDPYARQGGFPKANGSTAMSVIFFEDGAMLGCDRVELAADLMRKLKTRQH